MSVYNITIQVQQTYNWLCFMNIVPQTVKNMHWNNVYCLIELDYIILFSQIKDLYQDTPYDVYSKEAHMYCSIS